MNEDVLGEMHGKVPGILASAVVSRDGVLIASRVPEDASPDTFAIMLATTMGAAATAHNEIGYKPPGRVISTGPDSTMIIEAVNQNIFLAVVVKAEVPVGTIHPQIKAAVDALQR
ncbi:MAG: roadblock/LC7 domain-containing protein [Candidatus Thermoplasmatota archaeon]